MLQTPMETQEDFRVVSIVIVLLYKRENMSTKFIKFRNTTFHENTFNISQAVTSRCFPKYRGGGEWAMPSWSQPMKKGKFQLYLLVVRDGQ
jgi:hypothetical protein